MLKAIFQTYADSFPLPQEALGFKLWSGCILFYNTNVTRDYISEMNSVKFGEIVGLFLFPLNLSFEEKTTCDTFE